MNSEPNRKYKRPKQKTIATTNPGSSRPRNRRSPLLLTSEPLCPLLAKDSEWVDILDTQTSSINSSDSIPEEEEVLQLVDCEDGPQMKPLAIMFPGLLDKDPQTLQGMLDRVMSTTEVTRHLVDLGQKANFTFMKKADKLIPPDKQWLESVMESSNSQTSVESRQNLIKSEATRSSDYEADCELDCGFADQPEDMKQRKKKKLIPVNSNHPPPQPHQQGNLRKLNDKDLNCRSDTTDTDA